MKWISLVFALSTALNAAEPRVRSYEGVLTIPTYEPSARETEPPLFPNSTVTGMYPFTTYILPFKGAPKQRSYRAIFVENEYLKLTYIPEFGGRIFSVYDKLRQREMFYRNDVIKPAPYNPRNSWSQSGLELTGPHDLHMLTLHGEPFWANRIVRGEDGSISLVLAELDPVYGMKVNLSATLHAGIAALEIAVFCYNTQNGRKPQMFWINSAISATPKTRFIYPMSRTVGHTTADIADWPLYNGIDYSWDRNNKNMLGVFGIDIYDNFQGAYQFDRDYGIFRYADRRIVQGMKLWTFGYGAGSKSHEEGYTDNAGPYVELQSGRHVWDGHYEWVAPHKVESWNEWWIPVSQTGGLTTLTRDVALNLDVRPDAKGKDSMVDLKLGAVRELRGAKLSIKATCGDILNRSLDLDPAKPFHTEISGIKTDGQGLSGMVVRVLDSSRNTLLEYHRPDENPGRKEYTPFTKTLEQPHKSPEEMSTEELTLAGEFRLKELDEAGAQALFDAALKRDPGYSRAHLLMGITDFNDERYESAIRHLTTAIERDPYDDTAYYYLAMSEFANGRTKEAERNLYYVWPDSAYYGEREYQLGRLAFERRNQDEAITHFRRAVAANGYDLFAHLALAVTLRRGGDKAGALNELAAIDRLDPVDTFAQAERYFLARDPVSEGELLRLAGRQTQEAIGVTSFYRDLGEWQEAAEILELTKQNQRDPWGTTPIFFYTLAYCERRAGHIEAADEALKDARDAAGKVDRFPYREQSEAPLAEAVLLNPHDAVARFNLACFLYYRGKPSKAIQEWEAAVSIDPGYFSARRALGLAYAEQGFPVEKAAEQLEKAVELNPAHVRTLDDLSLLYARAGRFDDQLVVLKKGLARAPSDDNLVEGVLTAYLSKGTYREAERLIETHNFAPRHRTYGLRDKYRVARYGQGAEAFRKKDYKRALELFQSALEPPVSLGVDDFRAQTSPRIEYYMGRTLEALGEPAEARKAYEKSITGIEHLSGDRDSWSSENFYMVLALERLGRKAEAARLLPHFSKFADTEMDSKNAPQRAQARYLLALVAMHDGDSESARKLLADALQAEPDLLAARLELRGDVVPISSNS